MAYVDLVPQTVNLLMISDTTLEQQIALTPTSSTNAGVNITGWTLLNIVISPTQMPLEAAAEFSAHETLAIHTAAAGAAVLTFTPGTSYVPGTYNCAVTGSSDGTISQVLGQGQIQIR